ncbi:unnamed protein product [Arctogadus glacialis]
MKGEILEAKGKDMSSTSIHFDVLGKSPPGPPPPLPLASHLLPASGSGVPGCGGCVGWKLRKLLMAKALRRLPFRVLCASPLLRRRQGEVPRT